MSDSISLNVIFTCKGPYENTKELFEYFFSTMGLFCIGYVPELIYPKGSSSDRTDNGDDSQVILFGDSTMS